MSWTLSPAKTGVQVGNLCIHAPVGVYWLDLGSTLGFIHFFYNYSLGLVFGKYKTVSLKFTMHCVLEQV